MMQRSLRLCRDAERAVDLGLDLSMATRHGLITGATGTGKTVTLQALAEGFSMAGVPVFCCDVKGDLAGLAAPGSASAKISGAFAKLGLAQPEWRANPAAFWDVRGVQGHPLRATVSDLGPLLLGRLLGLSEVQADTLRVLFRLADDRDLAVIDLADLRALVEFASANAALLKAEYGLLSGTSLGAIQRAVLVLEDEGAGSFFGEPALEVADLMRVDASGRGLVSVLAADALMAEPGLYAATLLHLLGEVFEELPEAGDLDKPKLVLLLDEAHLLFDGAPDALVDAVERTARLVRSKGVGLWLVTQSPLDVPESVLGQLGNRVHHALRAYTPKDRKALDSVAANLRPNPRVDAAAAIAELGVGEALVSFLDAEGRPAPVERVRVVPPASRVGPLEAAERAAILAGSPFAAKYDKAANPVSASEILRGRASGGPAAEGARGPSAGTAGAKGAREPTIEEIEAELSGRSLPRLEGGPEPLEPSGDDWFDAADDGGAAPSARRQPRTRGAASGRDAGVFAERLAQAALQAAGRELGRQVLRGLLGTRRRRR